MALDASTKGSGGQTGLLLPKPKQTRLFDAEDDPERKENLDQWFTDPKLAEEFVRWSRVKPGMRVLEPTAGSGNLVKPLLAAGAIVTCYELDPEWVAFLRKNFPAATVYDAANFLDVPPPRHRGEPLFDLCAMNPPLSQGLDGVFLQRTIFRWAKRTTAIVQTRTMHSIDRREKVWRKAKVNRFKFLSDRPSFGRGSPMRDFSFVDAQPRDTPREGLDDDDQAMIGFL